MEWWPAGLLRQAVEVKEGELQPLLEVLSERPDHPLNLRMGFFATGTSHDLTHALRREDGTLGIVCMMKRVELGIDLKLRPIAPLDNIGKNAEILSDAGVSAFFVHTDTPRSMVNVGDLDQVVRCAPSAVVARSDLIIHPVQIAEAAEVGARAVVLVAAACLPDLEELLNSATSMGLEAVVECHTELERDFAIEAGATLLYLTNRDRSTDKLVPGRAEALRDAVPHWVLTIGGGGLTTASDCWSLLDAGFNGVALGRSLLQTPRPQGFIEEIRSQRAFAMDPFAGRTTNPFLDENLSL